LSHLAALVFEENSLINSIFALYKDTDRALVGTSPNIKLSEPEPNGETGAAKQVSKITNENISIPYFSKALCNKTLDLLPPT